MAKAPLGTSKPNWLLIKDYASGGLGSVFRVEMDVRLGDDDFKKLHKLLEATNIDVGKVLKVLKPLLKASNEITNLKHGSVHFLAAAFGREEYDGVPSKAKK